METDTTIEIIDLGDELLIIQLGFAGLDLTPSSPRVAAWYKAHQGWGDPPPYLGRWGIPQILALAYKLAPLLTYSVMLAAIQKIEAHRAEREAA